MVTPLVIPTIIVEEIISMTTDCNHWIQPLSATLGIKGFFRRFKSETFSRTIIEPGFDLYQMVLRDGSQIGLFWQETPYQANGILNGPPFITMERFAEVGACPEDFIGAHMLCVLRAVVVSDGQP